MRIVIYPEMGSEPNHYISMFARTLTGFGGSVCDWDEREEQAGPPDAVVLHWLENKFVPKPTGSKGLRQRMLAQRARLKKIEPVLHELAKMRSQGTRVVWVAHNRRPHRWQGSASQYRRVSRPLWPQVDAVVHLTRASVVDPAFDHLKNHPHAVVPHMHYSLVDATLHQSRATDVTRLAFIGGLAPRKKAMPVIATTLRATDYEVVLTQAGKRDDVELSSFLDSIPIELHERLVSLDRPSDDELNGIFDGRTVAVLTDEEALNSGVMFLALSRGAPVIAPRNAVNLEVQAEVGEEWLRLYPSRELGAETLRSLCSEPIPTVRPDLARRDPLITGRVMWDFLTSLAPSE
jgi:hypothetical protein